MTNRNQSIMTSTDLREEEENVGRNMSDNQTMGDIINRRFSRRAFMQGTLAVSAIATTISPLALITADGALTEAISALRKNVFGSSGCRLLQ